MVPSNGSDSLRATISFASGSGKPVTYYGPTVTLPKTGSVMVPLPTCSMTYTAPPPVSPDTLYTANQNPNPGTLFTISLIN